MRIDVVGLFPERILAVGEYGVIGRAVKQGVLVLQGWNPRDYATDRHRTVDDRPYGGGPGMLMMVGPLQQAIRVARAENSGRVVYLSPQGRRLDQTAVKRFAEGGNLVLVAGRYEGVDERLIALEVDEECSIGDYVLSGGELAAMVLIDAVARLLPGTLGAAESARQDSFMDGLLDCPHYTRPEEIDGLRVPGVLCSGDHGKITRWRLKQALGRTFERRSDWLKKRGLNAEEELLLEEYLRERQQEPEV